MKCIKCGRETGEKWKKLCLACYKKQPKRYKKKSRRRNDNGISHITQGIKPEEEAWRKTHICHSCRKKDECLDGQKRNRTYGAIIRHCTGYSKENVIT